MSCKGCDMSIQQQYAAPCFKGNTPLRNVSPAWMVIKYSCLRVDKDIKAPDTHRHFMMVLRVTITFGFFL